MSQFYTFSQNNSGGRFHNDEDHGIAKFVIIEADTADEANERATDIGLYFFGADDGPDCPCCGDRWDQVGECDGESEPSIYSNPVRSLNRAPLAEIGLDEGYVHPKQGGFYAVTAEDE